MYESKKNKIKSTSCCYNTFVIQHDVFRFEISVNNPVRVKVTQGQSDLP